MQNVQKNKVEEIYEYLKQSDNLESYLNILDELRTCISIEQYHTLLNLILLKMKCMDLEQVSEKLLPEEIGYIRRRALQKNSDFDMICKFIYDDILDADERKKHINEIIKYGYSECIYMLLIKGNLTNSGTKRLEETLKKVNDEYYFYYLVRTKK